MDIDQNSILQSDLLDTEEIEKRIPDQDTHMAQDEVLQPQLKIIKPQGQRSEKILLTSSSISAGVLEEAINRCVGNESARYLEAQQIPQQQQRWEKQTKAIAVDLEECRKKPHCPVTRARYQELADMFSKVRANAKAVEEGKVAPHDLPPYSQQVIITDPIQAAVDEVFARVGQKRKHHQRSQAPLKDRFQGRFKKGSDKVGKRLIPEGAEGPEDASQLQNKLRTAWNDLVTQPQGAQALSSRFGDLAALVEKHMRNIYQDQLQWRVKALHFLWTAVMVTLWKQHQSHGRVNTIAKSHYRGAPNAMYSDARLLLLRKFFTRLGQLFSINQESIPVGKDPVIEQKRNPTLREQLDSILFQWEREGPQPLGASQTDLLRRVGSIAFGKVKLKHLLMFLPDLRHGLRWLDKLQYDLISRGHMYWWFTSMEIFRQETNEQFDKHNDCRDLCEPYREWSVNFLVLDADGTEQDDRLDRAKESRLNGDLVGAALVQYLKGGLLKLFRCGHHQLNTAKFQLTHGEWYQNMKTIANVTEYQNPNRGSRGKKSYQIEKSQALIPSVLERMGRAPTEFAKKDLSTQGLEGATPEARAQDQIHTKQCFIEATGNQQVAQTLDENETVRKGKQLFDPKERDRYKKQMEGTVQDVNADVLKRFWLVLNIWHPQPRAASESTRSALVDKLVETNEFRDHLLEFRGVAKGPGGGQEPTLLWRSTQLCYEFMQLSKYMSKAFTLANRYLDAKIVPKLDSAADPNSKRESHKQKMRSRFRARSSIDTEYFCTGIKPSRCKQRPQQLEHEKHLTQLGMLMEHEAVKVVFGRAIKSKPIEVVFGQCLFVNYHFAEERFYHVIQDELQPLVTLLVSEHIVSTTKLSEKKEPVAWLAQVEELQQMELLRRAFCLMLLQEVFQVVRTSIKEAAELDTALMRELQLRSLLENSDQILDTQTVKGFHALQRGGKVDPSTKDAAVLQSHGLKFARMKKQPKQSDTIAYLTGYVWANTDVEKNNIKQAISTARDKAVCRVCQKPINRELCDCKQRDAQLSNRQRLEVQVIDLYVAQAVKNKLLEKVSRKDAVAAYEEAYGPAAEIYEDKEGKNLRANHLFMTGDEDLEECRLVCDHALANKVLKLDPVACDVFNAIYPPYGEGDGRNSSAVRKMLYPGINGLMQIDLESCYYQIRIPKSMRVHFTVRWGGEYYLPNGCFHGYQSAHVFIALWQQFVYGTTQRCLQFYAHSQYGHIQRGDRLFKQQPTKKQKTSALSDIDQLVASQVKLSSEFEEFQELQPAPQEIVQLVNEVRKTSAEKVDTALLYMRSLRQLTKHNYKFCANVLAALHARMRDDGRDNMEGHLHTLERWHRIIDDVSVASISKQHLANIFATMSLVYQRCGIRISLKKSTLKASQMLRLEYQHSGDTEIASFKLPRYLIEKLEKYQKALSAQFTATRTLKPPSSKEHSLWSAQNLLDVRYTIIYLQDFAPIIKVQWKYLYEKLCALTLHQEIRQKFSVYSVGDDYQHHINTLSPKQLKNEEQDVLNALKDFNADLKATKLHGREFQPYGEAKAKLSCSDASRSCIGVYQARKIKEDSTLRKLLDRQEVGYELHPDELKKIGLAIKKHTVGEVFAVDCILAIKLVAHHVCTTKNDYVRIVEQLGLPRFGPMDSVQQYKEYHQHLKAIRTRLCQFSMELLALMFTVIINLPHKHQVIYTDALAVLKAFDRIHIKQDDKLSNLFILFRTFLEVNDVRIYVEWIPGGVNPADITTRVSDTYLIAQYATFVNTMALNLPSEESLGYGTFASHQLFYRLTELLPHLYKDEQSYAAYDPDEFLMAQVVATLFDPNFLDYAQVIMEEQLDYKHSSHAQGVLYAFGELVAYVGEVNLDGRLYGRAQQAIAALFKETNALYHQEEGNDAASDVFRFWTHKILKIQSQGEQPNRSRGCATFLESVYRDGKALQDNKVHYVMLFPKGAYNMRERERLSTDVPEENKKVIALANTVLEIGKQAFNASLLSGGQDEQRTTKKFLEFVQQLQPDISKAQKNKKDLSHVQGGYKQAARPLTIRTELSREFFRSVGATLGKAQIREEYDQVHQMSQAREHQVLNLTARLVINLIADASPSEAVEILQDAFQLKGEFAMYRARTEMDLSESLFSKFIEGAYPSWPCFEKLTMRVLKLEEAQATIEFIEANAGVEGLEGANVVAQVKHYFSTLATHEVLGLSIAELLAQLRRTPFEQDLNRLECWDLSLEDIVAYLEAVRYALLQIRRPFPVYTRNPEFNAHYMSGETLKTVAKCVYSIYQRRVLRKRPDKFGQVRADQDVGTKDGQLGLEFFKQTIGGQGIIYQAECLRTFEQLADQLRIEPVRERPGTRNRPGTVDFFTFRPYATSKLRKKLDADYEQQKGKEVKPAVQKDDLDVDTEAAKAWFLEMTGTEQVVLTGDQTLLEDYARKNQASDPQRWKEAAQTPSQLANTSQYVQYQAKWDMQEQPDPMEGESLLNSPIWFNFLKSKYRQVSDDAVAAPYRHSELRSYVMHQYEKASSVAAYRGLGKVKQTKN